MEVSADITGLGADDEIPTEDAGSARLIRPYAMTGGRTTAHPDISLESQVQTSTRLNGDGQPGTPPFMIKALEDTILKGNDVLVEINPDTARQLGLSEGRLANLATPIGSAQVKVRLTQGIMPGVAAVPRGLGHSGDNKFLDGKGVNYNRLSSPVDDPASGYNAAWGIRAKLSKA